MTRATRCAEYSGAATPCLYLAFELGVEEWKLGFTTDPATKPRVRVVPARDRRRVVAEIAEAKKWFGLNANTVVRSCYEAGRDGFWLHRYLTSIGIENGIVDSSSIEVNRHLRRAKSDGMDVRKLLSMLLRYHAGEMAWCWLRYQPRSRLSRWYQRRFAAGGPRARKVGIVLWRFLEHGVVPEGAKLKA